jgi:deoxyribodipyrimidine photo-lyase
MNNLVWFRNDLRVHDNTSLFEACKKGGKVLAVYCLDPRHCAETKYGFKKTEKFVKFFIVHSIKVI